MNFRRKILETKSKTRGLWKPNPETKIAESWYGFFSQMVRKDGRILKWNL